MFALRENLKEESLMPPVLAIMPACQLVGVSDGRQCGNKVVSSRGKRIPSRDQSGNRDG